MADKPIIFSAPMVRALLGGRKTQTRRVIKAAGRSPEFCGGRYDAKSDPECWGWEDHERGEWITLDQWRRWNFVPFAPGDRLYVREAHAMVPSSAYRMSEGVSQAIDPSDRDRACVYREGWERCAPRWRPSIHMPRWASRLTLTVTDVRVQRLQEISETDALAEGAMTEYGEGSVISHRRAFNLIWNHLHGPGAWDANPWVAAYTFTVERGNIDDLARGNG